jgi:hypothetical protein
MPKTHFVNAQKVAALADVLHVLHGAKVEFTVKVSVEELLKLQPEQLKAFFNGIAEVAAVEAKVELTENE